MNLNVKLESEEEQTIQYVNRFAINIPSTFNLNIVNSGLNSQSYILNSVNPVGQNIVAYQPPMAVQSYFTLPTAEPEGNILHSLPVGVPVPVGLPVQTGFLQNHNFMNTSIIIGNEDCNSSGVLDSSSNHIDPEEDVKINYLQKSIDEVIEGSEPHSTGLNSENVIKKPCPLEMSIKAANIDEEFEKCEQDVPILIEGNHLEANDGKLITNTTQLENEPENSGIDVTSFHHSNETTNSKYGELKKLKTEITWDNNDFKDELSNNNFQESLICEVEEVNDDEGEDGENEEKNCNDQNESKCSSSEESDALPLSVALKLKKLPDLKNNRKLSERKRAKKKKSELTSAGNLEKAKGKKCRKSIDTKSDDEWSESDDGVLNLKRIKNEFNYKYFYEPKTVKSSTVLPLKVNNGSKKFVRVRSCCSKKECCKQVCVKDQMEVHKFFISLETEIKKDEYLITCIEHVQKNQTKQTENFEENNVDFLQKIENQNSLMTSNIRLEIENESNGNQKLSDEIQNAINESLKDCIDIEGNNKTCNKTLLEESFMNDKEDKNNWNYYVTIDGEQKKVCLQFLLKLFHITKTRIKQLQKKILSGVPLRDDLNNLKCNQKIQEVWEMAKVHLGSLASEECLDCSLNPRHRYFPRDYSKDDLYASFKDFFYNRKGKELNLKYSSYKRFLDKETLVSLMPKKDGVCVECEDLKTKKRQIRNSKDFTKVQKSKSSSDSRSRKKKNECEYSASDDESLLKRKKLKLTIPLKGIINPNKVSQVHGKRNYKNSCGDKRNKTKLFKEKSQSLNRGRDVWSLMLLHLETMPYKECNSCTNKIKHRFLDSTYTAQGLYEDYRKYFLKETNSELGLGFTMYEKYFNRNCNYTIMDLSLNELRCPRCVADESRS